MEEIKILSDPYQFEMMRIHLGLSIVKIKNTDKIIGYINMNPTTQWWFYFIKDFISQSYSSEGEAIEALLIHFYSKKLDKLTNNSTNIIVP